MLKASNEAIQKARSSSEEFNLLFEEHVRLEQDLEALYSLKYYPPEVEMKIKEIKILKLRGKDRMEQILAAVDSTGLGH